MQDHRLKPNRDPMMDRNTEDECTIRKWSAEQELHPKHKFLVKVEKI